MIEFLNNALPFINYFTEGSFWTQRSKLFVFKFRMCVKTMLLKRGVSKLECVFGTLKQQDIETVLGTISINIIIIIIGIKNKDMAMICICGKAPAFSLTSLFQSF